MPFIHTRTNLEITPDLEKSLKEKLGQAIEKIPGKSERYLMLQFSDNCRLYFHGDSHEPLAFVEVMIYGSASDSAYDGLTAAITAVLTETLGIPAANIYLEYQQTPHWGWNGRNF